MSAHTPGPWTAYKFERNGLHGFVIMADNEEMLEIAEMYPKPEPVAVSAENASLIAAAPALLKALEMMVSSYDNLTDDEIASAVARAAIAQAKGESK